MQVPVAVRLQRLQEEHRREAVGNTRLDRDARPERAHDRVEVRGFGVADRAQREPLAAPLDRLFVLAAALEQVLAQTALAELLLVPR